MKVTSSNLVRPIFIQKSGEKIKSKYPALFFSALFIAIVLLGFYMTKPFLIAVITGAIIAYLSYSLYEKASKYIHNRSIAAALVTTLILLLVTVPAIAVLGMVSKEAYYTYTTLNQQNLGTNFVKVVCKSEESFACSSTTYLIGMLPENEAIKSFSTPEAKLDYYLRITIKKLTEFIIENFSKFLVSLPTMLLNMFVTIFVVYYLFKDGRDVAKRIKSILPLSEPHKQQVIQRFHDLTYGTFYGNIFVAIIQGFLGGLGFYFFGVPSPILWGFVMAFFALLPYFGTAIIWVPASLNLVFIGYLQNDNSYIINGVILFLYGALIVSTIDNILKPKIIGSKANLHPVLVLLGVLGGLNFFGFIGIIVGPVILALLVTFVTIYEKEKGQIQKYF